MFEVFNDRDPFYLSHTAPVAAGVGVRFCILLHENCHCSEAFLVLRPDGGEAVRLPMTWAERTGDFHRYEVTVTPESAGLYWYRFEYEGDWRRNVITRFAHGLGDIRPDGGDWQLTVYEPDFAPPEKYRGGLIYQVFPDRFCASGEPKANVPDDRYRCGDWYAQPAYRQTDDKRRLCNDYYGGDLKGITSKLDYLAELGVTILYLNPIFEAHSNHRYNTADYTRIDPLLGTEEDFVVLCREAGRRGIAVILDGVFSHTGSDSRYYNQFGRYPEPGAYNSQESPYSSWYRFSDWPNGCHCWWDMPTLPEVVEDDPSFTEFICGESGILRRWMRLGASGWRLDVADELPDAFLDRVRQAIKAENPDGLLIGEVWEDASNKVSHGGRRRFLLGRQLDSVMNYPFREAIIRFVTGGDAQDFNDAVMDVLGHYPRGVVDLLMNLVGTHDTERILSVLGGAPLGLNREEQAGVVLSDSQRANGLRLLRLAAVLQYTLPGIPSLYYGDEAGCEGLRDPFNRAGYPWGKEDRELLAFYKKLGKMRRLPAFDGGDYVPLDIGLGHIVYVRKKGNCQVLVAVNRWTQPERVRIPEDFGEARVLFGAKPCGGELEIGERDFVILAKD